MTWVAHRTEEDEVAAKRLTGHITFGSYEDVFYDPARAAQGLPPWRSVRAPNGRFYLDSEVKRYEVPQ